MPWLRFLNNSETEYILKVLVQFRKGVIRRYFCTRTGPADRKAPFFAGFILNNSVYENRRESFFDRQARYLKSGRIVGQSRSIRRIYLSRRMEGSGVS